MTSYDGVVVPPTPAADVILASQQNTATSITANYKITYSGMFTFYLVYPNNSLQGLADCILLTPSADRSSYLLKRLKAYTGRHSGPAHDVSSHT
jgi:hypothetical protein